MPEEWPVGAQPRYPGLAYLPCAASCRTPRRRPHGLVTGGTMEWLLAAADLIVGLGVDEAEMIPAACRCARCCWRTVPQRPGPAYFPGATALDIPLPAAIGVLANHHGEHDWPPGAVPARRGTQSALRLSQKAAARPGFLSPVHFTPCADLRRFHRANLPWYEEPSCLAPPGLSAQHLTVRGCPSMPWGKTSGMSHNISQKRRRKPTDAEAWHLSGQRGAHNCQPSQNVSDV